MICRASMKGNANRGAIFAPLICLQFVHIFKSAIFADLFKILYRNRMSIIQQIQEKYGKLMAVIIGISLVIFVVMLAFENGGSLFNSTSMTVGKINGKTVDIQDFQGLVEQQTQQMEAQGMGGGEQVAQRANDAAWTQEIARVVLSEETEKLGLSIGKKELNDMLFGSNPPRELAQAFTDPNTGEYNGAVAQQQINQIKTKGTAEQKAQLNAFLDQLVFQFLAAKYDALLVNSINLPKWLLEKQNADNSLMSKISYVTEPYTSIPDSTVKVSDSDVQKFVNKHKDDFKQTESRSIQYVAFSAQPTAADSNASMKNILELKTAFDTTHNVNDFLISQGINTFYNSYISGSRIQVPMKDSIFRVGAGHIYGPYIDGNNYALAKVIGAKSIPDTVNIRHILIGTMQPDPQSGQMVPIRDSATARHLADSIALAIRSGSNFDSLVVKFSDDPGSAGNKGVYENVPAGQMVAEFNDFIFGNPTGSKGVVKTNYGYHYIEILSQKGSSMAYKIAYISKPIVASQETDMAARNAATKFAAEAKDLKTFDALGDKLQKEHLANKSLATEIPPSGNNIMGLGVSRAFVKNIYNTDLNKIIGPERVGEFEVVGIVTEINDEGTMPVNKVRIQIEPYLRNLKKADIIKNKLGKVTTLEAAASTFKQTVQVADSLQFSGSGGSQMLGFEPKVLGASFNKTYLGKVIPDAIPGIQGIYVVRVDNITSTPVQNTNLYEGKLNREKEMKQQAAFQSIQVLQQAATIKDYRNKFY